MIPGSGHYNLHLKELGHKDTKSFAQDNIAGIGEPGSTARQSNS